MTQETSSEKIPYEELLDKLVDQVMTKGVLEVRGDVDQIRQAFRSFYSEIHRSKQDDERQYQVNFYTMTAFHHFELLIDHFVRCGVSAAALAAHIYVRAGLAVLEGDPEDEVKKRLPTAAHLNQLILFFTKQLRSVLITKPKQVREHDLRNLRAHFERTYSEIKDAKKLYKQNSRRDSWKAIVLAVHPDIDDDLIDRLVGDDHYKDRPKYLALEWAARLCGVPPNRFTARHLETVLSKGKNCELKTKRLSSQKKG